MKQNPTWEADSRSDSQEIQPLYGTLRGILLYALLLDPILS
jgi:hypothetical protein